MSIKNVCLVGQPNSGKTTIFNALTGMRQSVGNFPGVTVEIKNGRMDGSECGRIEITDLPGTYSLSPASPEEAVTRDFLLEERTDLIVNVIDGLHLQRGIFLTLQIISLGVPALLVITMKDEIEKRGIKIDADKMSRMLQIPVLIINANGPDISDVRNEVDRICASKNPGAPSGEVLYRGEIGRLVRERHGELFSEGVSNPLFFAIKALERDEAAKKYFKNTENSDTDEDRVISWMHETAMQICNESARQERRERKPSPVIDSILLNRFAAAPIFMAVLLAIFFTTFYAGGYVSSSISFLLKRVSEWTLTGVGSPFIRDLIETGVIGGAGNILTLLPYIFIMVFLLKMIEDIGYSARVAYIMDYAMSKIGLHGKSFIPIILGFGCTVPAVMSARTIDSRTDRLKTILITPFIPCSSRFMVAAFIAGALYREKAYWMLFLLYLIDIAAAFAGGFLLDRLFIRAKSESIILEMPQYRRLNLKNVSGEAFRESGEFLKKASSIILFLSVVVFLLSHFPAGEEYGYLGMAAERITPLFSVFEFDKPMTVSLITGFAAKESIISTLSVMYQDTGHTLSSYVASNWSRSGGFLFLVFSMLYIPCLASIAAIRRETGSLRWTMFAIVYSFLVSFAATAAVKGIIWAAGFLI